MLKVSTFVLISCSDVRHWIFSSDESRRFFSPSKIVWAALLRLEEQTTLLEGSRMACTSPKCSPR